MKTMQKAILITGIALAVVGGGAYVALMPNVWERDASGSIKAGDYDEAIKVAKRGLIEKPGSHKLQALFLAATALNRARDSEGSWAQETVSEGMSRYLADLNIAGPLSGAKDLWVDGETRQKSVDLAQDELREIRKGCAAKGMALESVESLKTIGVGAARAFIGMKLDVEKHEVQRANLAAYKTLALLGEKDGITGLIAACEAGKDLDQWERIRALMIVGAQDFPGLKKIAFDKGHSLYKDARMALTLTLWDSEEGYASLANFDQAKLEPPTGRNWDDLAVLSTVEAAKRKRMQGGAAGLRNVWATDNKALVGAGFAWSVPILAKNGQSGYGTVARVELDGVKILPLDHWVHVENVGDASIQTDGGGAAGDPTRIALWIAKRSEQGTEYRDATRYSPWKGFFTVKEPYQTLTEMDYWSVFVYNPSTKRMEQQGLRKGKTPLAADAPTVASLPAS